MATSLTSLNNLQHDSISPRPYSWKINRNYIPLKIIFFAFMAGQATHVVFRSLFIKHLGMSTTQNGIIWAADRVVGVFVPPFLGWITDKSGRPKSTIVWTFLTGSIICFSLYFIPPETHTFHISDSRESGCFASSCSHNTSRQVTCFSLSHNYSCVNAMELPVLRPNCSATNSSIASVEEDGPVLVQPLSGSIVMFNESLEETFKLSCFVDYSTLSKVLNPTDALLQSDIDEMLKPFQICLCLPNSTFWTGEKVPVDKYGYTFWVLLILMVLSSFSVFGGNTLVDTWVLNSFTEKNKHKFSLQRLWGGLGFGAAAVVVGLIKDCIASAVSDPHSNLMFLPCFLGPGLFWSILCVTLSCFNSRGTEERLDVKIRFSGLKTLLTNIRIPPFLLFAIVVGYAIAVGEVYMFWLAEQRFNASSTILAASIAISTCFEALSYLLSGRLVRRFGPRIIMSVGLMIFGIRVYLYTLVTKAWHLLFAEILRGLGWPATWTATCYLTSKISPPGLVTTTMGLLQACTFGIGYGLGAVLGGYLFEKYGADYMFKISFALIVSSSISYIIFYKCYDKFERKRRKNVTAGAEEIQTLKNGDLNHNVTWSEGDVSTTIRRTSNGVEE